MKPNLSLSSIIILISIALTNYSSAQKVWTKLNSGTSKLLYMPFFSDSTTGTIVGQEGTIIRTSDGGETWIQQNSTSLHSLTSLYFSDPSNGIVVGASGTVLRTEDGGQSWINQNSGFTFLFLTAVSFPSDSVGTAVGENGLIIKTTDNGRTWLSQNSGTSNWLYGVSFVNENVGTTVGLTGKIIHTTNGGQSWLNQNSGITDDLVGVFFTDANTGTAVGYKGTILRTTNGGQSWIKQNSGTSNWLRGIYFIDSNNGIVAGEKGIILKTSDGGQNWVQLGSGTNSSLVGVFMKAPDSGMIVGFDGTVLKLKSVNHYTISAAASPTGGGTLTGAGNYQPGQSVTLKAVSNIYFRFINWTENGTIVSTDSTYQFSATCNRYLTANFSTNRILYNVSTYSIPSAGGTTGGNGEYASGQSVTVNASPSAYYDFINWTENGNVVSIDSNYTFTITSNRNLAANFYPPKPLYTVSFSINPLIGGKVTGGGTFPFGHSVLLTAVPNQDFSFTNWTENRTIVSTESTYQFLLISNRSLTANFYAVNRPTLVVNPDIAFYISASAGDGILIVKNASGGTLNWTASSNVNWITITSGNSGHNSGSVNFSYQANYNGYRFGNIRVTAVGAIASPKSVEIWQSGVTDVDNRQELPTKLDLFQNYPNPFNPVTTIEFAIPSTGFYSLKVYNILGQEVDKLIEREMEIGFHKISFDGSTLPSGMYIYRLCGNNISIIKKMILMK